MYVCIPVDSTPCKFLVKASVSSPLIDVVCSVLLESVYRLDCDFGPSMLLMSTQMSTDKPELTCLCKDEVDCEPGTSEHGFRAEATACQALSSSTHKPWKYLL